VSAEQPSSARPSTAGRKAVIAFDCLFPNQTGGGERVYRALADELLRQGWRVEYLTRDDAAIEPVGFQVTSVWRGELYDADGVRRIGPALRFAWSLFRALSRRRSADLFVVSATPVLNVFAAALALAGRPHRRLFVDWLEIWPLRKWREYSGAIAGTIAAAMQAAALRLSANVTGDSEATISRMPAAVKRTGPILMGLTGLGEPPQARVAGSANHPVVVLTVGRLIADKRVDAIPAALAELMVTMPEARAVIVGTGPEEAAVRAAAAQAGMLDRVDFLGRVSDQELDELYRRASVLLNPSVREGFGLVVVEAAERGTPSVVIPGPNNAAADLIQPGVNGFLAASHAPKDLAAALCAAVQAGDPLRASTLGWAQASRRGKSMQDSVLALLKHLDETS